MANEDLTVQAEGMSHQGPTHHPCTSGHGDDVRVVHRVDAGAIGFVQWIEIIQTLGIERICDVATILCIIYDVIYI